MLTIMLATYNGEKYLPAQLDSLMAQTFTEFTIWVQDDVSTDSTWEILEDYNVRYPGKFHLNRRTENSGSSKNNFLDLMTTIRDSYLMLCDQDDIWLPNKIEVTMAKMKAMEEVHPNLPLLVHTDLKVVDHDLKVISPSFRQQTMRDYTRMGLRHVLNLNNVSGCTVMYNRALAELLIASPKHCVMHDWWLQLVATACGKVDHINEATILYRQHGKNVCGAKDVRKISYKLGRLLKGGDLKAVLHETCRQAGCLLDMYYDKLTDTQRQILQGYSAIPQIRKIKRIQTILQLRIFMPSLSRNIALLLFI